MKYDLFIFTTAICRPDLHLQCIYPFAKALSDQQIKTKWFINIDPFPSPELVNVTKDNLLKCLDFPEIDADFTTPDSPCFYTAVKTLVSKAGEEIDSLNGHVMPLEDDWKQNIDFEVRELLDSEYEYIGFHGHDLLIGDLSFNPSLWSKDFFLNFVKKPFDLNSSPLDPEQVVINYHKENISKGNNYFLNVNKVCFQGVFEDAGRDWAVVHNIHKWNKLQGAPSITYTPIFSEKEPEEKDRSTCDSCQEDYTEDYPDDIFLIQQFFTPPTPERLIDLQICLKQNLTGGLFSQIILLVEKAYTPEELGLSSPHYQLVKQIDISKKLRFSDIFRYVRSLNLQGYICFSNADIVFDPTLRSIFNSSLHKSKMFFCQLRFNFINGQSLPFSGKFGLRSDSQDSWIFHSNCTPDQLDRFDFELGRAGSDNRLAHELHQLKYKLRNDPFKIKTHHIHQDTALSRNSNKSQSIPRPYLLVRPVCPDE